MRWSEVKSLSRVWLFATPWTVAYQALLSMGFSRQEYWSGLPFPSPGDLPNPGIEPGSPALQTDALPSEPPGKPWWQGQRHEERKCRTHEELPRNRKNCQKENSFLEDGNKTDQLELKHKHPAWTPKWMTEFKFFKTPELQVSAKNPGDHAVFQGRHVQQSRRVEPG